MPLLEVRDVRFSYRPGREVLRGVTLAVEPGQIVCLLGSNGTGKTTLLRCLLGLRRPSAGAVLLGGRDAAGRRRPDDPVGLHVCDKDLGDVDVRRPEILTPAKYAETYAEG